MLLINEDERDVEQSRQVVKLFTCHVVLLCNVPMAV